MAFKRVKQKIVKRDVKIFVPKDGKGAVEATLEVTFEILPNSEANRSSYDAEFFTRCIKNIGNYVDEDEQPIPFTPESLAELLDVSYVLSGMQRAYLEITVAAGKGN